MGRGGHREGAGRKPSGKRKVVFYITEQEEAVLRLELARTRAKELYDQPSFETITESNKPLKLMTKEEAVMDWIDKNFDRDLVQINDFPLFPAGKRVIDAQKGEMVVFWDLATETIKYIFSDPKAVI